MDDKRKAELKRMLGWGSLSICTGIGAIIDNGIYPVPLLLSKTHACL